MLLAFFLRMYSAQHVDIGTDEMIYTVIPLNIVSAHRLSTVEQAPVYFYLVDIGYKLFGGMNLVTGRLPSIFFGSFAVLLVFLCALELSENKKSAIWSAFFFAISGYALKNNQEMDMTAFFFALLSMFFFLKVLQGKTKALYPSTIFLAIGALVKPIILLFTPAYALIWLISSYKQKNGIFKEVVTENATDVAEKKKRLLLSQNAIFMVLACLVLSIIIVSPVLIYNSLLYKDKGMTDYYFTVLAGIGNSQVYQEAEPWSIPRFFEISKRIFLNIFTLDVLLSVFGILGILVTFKRQALPVLLFLFSTFFLFLYLAGKMGSSTHYLWVPLVLSIFTGAGIVLIKEKLEEKFEKWKKVEVGKVFFTIVVIAAILSTGIVISKITPLKKTSIAITLQEYAQENFPSDAIVVLDPRIYRGIFAWAFPEKHYLEGTYFPQMVSTLPTLSGPKREIPLYYVECGPGTNCGWKPEDFQRIYGFGEELSTIFRTQTQKVGEIKAIDNLIIYKGSISASLEVYDIIDRTHSFWYTPVGWKYPEDAVDTYTVKTVFDKLLQGFGFFILYLDVLIVLLSPFLLVYLLWKQS